MTERHFWEELRAGLNGAAKPGELLLLRIETPTAVGVPDVFFATPRRCGWIELKVTTGPARPLLIAASDIPEPPIKFRHGQLTMLARLARLGVPAMVAVRTSGGMSMLRANSEGTLLQPDHDWFLWAPIDWAAVLEVLEGGP